MTLDTITSVLNKGGQHLAPYAELSQDRAQRCSRRLPHPQVLRTAPAVDRAGTASPARDTAAPRP
jgi:hypothetical protein